MAAAARAKRPARPRPPAARWQAVPESAAVSPGLPFSLRVLAVLWPAFLMAGVLETLVFALVDPAGLHWFGGTPME